MCSRANHPAERPQQSLEQDDRSAPPAEFGAVLQRYWVYLHGIARMQIDRRLRVRFSPSDVVQETFLEAHRDFPQFNGRTEAEFRAWLRRILVHNLIVAARRHLAAGKRDVRREISLDRGCADADASAPGLAGVVAHGGDSPSTHAQHAELLVAVTENLAALAPDYREVLEMRHLQGHAFQDIAKRMGRNEGAVRMLWLRAVTQLRARLTERGIV